MKKYVLIIFLLFNLNLFSADEASNWTSLHEAVIKGYGAVEELLEKSDNTDLLKMMETRFEGDTPADLVSIRIEALQRSPEEVKTSLEKMAASENPFIKELGLKKLEKPILSTEERAIRIIKQEELLSLLKKKEIELKYPGYLDEIMYFDGVPLDSLVDKQGLPLDRKGKPYTILDSDRYPYPKN